MKTLKSLLNESVFDIDSADITYSNKTFETTDKTMYKILAFNDGVLKISTTNNGLVNIIHINELLAAFPYADAFEFDEDINILHKLNLHVTRPLTLKNPKHSVIIDNTDYEAVKDIKIECLILHLTSQCTGKMNYINASCTDAFVVFKEKVSDIGSSIQAKVLQVSIDDKYREIFFPNPGYPKYFNATNADVIKLGFYKYDVYNMEDWQMFFKTRKLAKDFARIRFPKTYLTKDIEKSKDYFYTDIHITVIPNDSYIKISSFKTLF